MTRFRRLDLDDPDDVRRWALLTTRTLQLGRPSEESIAFRRERSLDSRVTVA